MLCFLLTLDVYNELAEAVGSRGRIHLQLYTFVI